MNLDFTEEQKELKAGLAKQLAEGGDIRGARAVLNAERTIDQPLLERLANLGWLGTATPEAYGGSNLGAIMLCAVAEELGRVLAAIPFSSMYIVAEAIRLYGDEQIRQSYLPALVDASKIGCFAFVEGPGPIRTDAIKAVVRDARLYGVKTAVAAGLTADFAVVVARNAAGSIGLHLVELANSGVEREALTSLDPTCEQAKLHFDGAACKSLEVAGWPAIEALMDGAAVLVAFEQLGGASRCLDLARDYALTRPAFGRRIGAFQAIKHKLAEMYIAIELARSNAYYAAWALEAGSSALPAAAAIARISATEAFERASRDLILTMGGIGITWDMDAHLFYRRARYLAVGLGSADHWRDLLVRRMVSKNVTAERAA